jgi:hypothetical protein
MFAKRFCSAAAVTFSLSLPSAGTTFAAEPCVFDKYTPLSASAYSVDQSSDYETVSALKGASLYIPAQEGLTREWLQLIMQRALMTRALATNDQTCHLTVKPEQIVVTSAGNGFWVHLIGHNEHDGARLLRWATSLVALKAQHATPKQ